MLEAMTRTTPGNCHIFFNTSQNVGIGQPNDPLDVLLVQFAYACTAKNPISSASPAAKQLYAKVTPGSPYSGRPDEVLSQAILTNQRERGTIQDGHVSRMRGALTYVGSRGEKGFMLISLSNNIYDLTKDVWPRIDKAPSCPALLGAAVKQLFRNE